MISTRILLPEELHSEIRHLSIDMRISMSEMVRRAIVEWLKGQEGEGK